MFQKAVKTADDTPKQKLRTMSAKHQHVDRGTGGDSRPETSFTLSQSVFSQAPSSARHSAAAAGPAARDESKTVSFL